MYNPFPLTANTISGVAYLDTLKQCGCCHSLTTFLVVTLCTRSSSNSRHRLLVSGNLSVSLEDRKYLRRIEQLQKFHVNW